MSSNCIIRGETQADWRIVEEITRKAFWNVNSPGCDEHYLVHTMRAHEDFISELDFVLELNKKVIGNIMYTKSQLCDENGNAKDVLTFGPLSVLPEFQRMGYGKKLIEHSFDVAVTMGFDSVVIFGNPSNYVTRGFKCAKRFNICMENDFYPTSLLAKELVGHPFDGRKWYYKESSAYNIDKTESERFDSEFEPMKKEFRPSQEEFYILSHSSITF